MAHVVQAWHANRSPLLTFEPLQPGEIALVRAASGDLLKKCFDLGGTITGEHGVGLEKQDFMVWLYNDGDLAQMKTLKAIFDPQGMLNPGKMFPGARAAQSPQRQVLS